MKGAPRSEQFDDIYFSADNGLAETHHVFIEGNNLLAAWTEQEHFVIAETGFGTGLNFLCAWDLLEKTAKKNGALDFISFEKYPLSPDKIKEYLSPWEDQFGDKVEILRGNKPAAPRGWEALAVSGRARAALRRLTRDQEIEEFRNLGRTLIDHTIKLAGFSPDDLNLEEVATKAGFESMADLNYAVGISDYTTEQFLEVAFPGHTSDKPEKISRMRADNDHLSLMIRGADLGTGRAIQLGTCCGPVPGDRIIGVAEPGKGLVVHVIDCHKLAEWDDMPERWVDLKWTSLAKTDALATGRILVNAANDRGVMAKLCQAIANANGNITSWKTRTRQEDYTDIVFDIEVEDLKRLTEILTALRSMSVVDTAERYRENDG